MIFETTILGRKELAVDTFEVTLKRPAEFTFVAGQYTQIQLPKLLKADPKGRSRQFSIVSSPSNFDEVKVVFRMTGSGFKETLLNLPVGSSLRLEQAAGSFVLPQTLTRPHVFVAGGVGISPFMSYVTERVNDHWDHPIRLFYGNQSPEKAAYLAELKSIEKIQSRFTLHSIYKQPTQELFAQCAKKHTDATWWVVGPPALVATATAGLRMAGIQDQHIKTEPFTGY